MSGKRKTCLDCSKKIIQPKRGRRLRCPSCAKIRQREQVDEYARKNYEEKLLYWRERSAAVRAGTWQFRSK